VLRFHDQHARSSRNSTLAARTLVNMLSSDKGWRATGTHLVPLLGWRNGAFRLEALPNASVDDNANRYDDARPIRNRDDPERRGRARFAQLHRLPSRRTPQSPREWWSEQRRDAASVTPRPSRQGAGVRPLQGRHDPAYLQHQRESRPRTKRRRRRQRSTRRRASPRSTTGSCVSSWGASAARLLSPQVVRAARVLRRPKLAFDRHRPRRRQRFQSRLDAERELALSLAIPRHDCRSSRSQSSLDYTSPTTCELLIVTLMPSGS
jgi:hypothetical protein